ncbi:MAG: hypothetical protein COZ57_31900 [Armatimonadetes bacterium CG_4_8_14_3_um_filter_66_20]|nr:MAG: hypothetical protein COZ57_31900 [Armatimonadetes bacterium CG_4_8_14_3_um_filter_66_20]
MRTQRALLPLLIALGATALAFAQPGEQPGAPGGGPDQPEWQERLAAIAQRLGDPELLEKLRSQDPKVRQEAVAQIQERMRDRMQNGPQGGGMFGGLGMFAPGMGGMPGVPGQVAVATTEKYLFVVRGNTVYQLDVDTLAVLKQTELPMPEGMVLGTGTGGPMRPPGGRGGQGANPRNPGAKQQ